MEVYIEEANTNKAVKADILLANRKDMPLQKDRWNFNWRSLYKTEGVCFYKLITQDDPQKIEALLMLTIFDDGMVFMNNIEVAPHNYGSSGIYARVAGCLIAFACQYSFQVGRGGYIGFLTFESKTALIELYQERYGATHIGSQKMYIPPNEGKKLMKRYL